MTRYKASAAVNFGLSDGHGDQRHGVVAEDVYHLDGHDVTAGAGVNVGGGGEFQFPVLARAKALPFVLKNIPVHGSGFATDLRERRPGRQVLDR